MLGLETNVMAGLAKTTALAVLIGHSGVVAADDMTVAAQRSFADSLTADLYKNENECTSSLGVSMAFDLIYPAAVGQSRQELQTVFGYPADNNALVWSQTTSELASIYKGECLFGQVVEQPQEEDVVSSQQADADAAASVCQKGEEPLVRVANSVWVRDDVALEASYAAVVGDLATQLNFDDQGAGGIVNDWVNDQTNGLIEEIVEDGALPENWILMAINTIYLKAAWKRPFMEAITSQDAFYTSAQRSALTSSPEARFMHQVEYFGYSETALAGYQVLSVPFAGDDEFTGGLSMIFVLPTMYPDDEKSAPLEPVSSEKLWSKLSLLQRTRVAVALPRFRIESKYEDSLKSSLMSTGLVAPFVGELCVQAGNCDSAVDYVVQKTVIDVNEKGVEAAAVTLLSLDRSAPPSRAIFLCDHPFQFFIHDANQDVFLFEGRVSNPGIPEDAPETAALDVSHKDTDFWRNYMSADLSMLPPSVPASEVAVDGDGDEARDNNMDGEDDTTTDTDGDGQTNTGDGAGDGDMGDGDTGDEQVDNQTGDESSSATTSGPLSLIAAMFWWLLAPFGLEG